MHRTAASAVNSSGSSLQRARRIVWNVLTRSDAARRYPDKLVHVVWKHLPASIRTGPLGRVLGRAIHHHACVRQIRRPNSEDTSFLRSLPLFGILRSLAGEWPARLPLTIASIGCSIGAELYSVMWVVRSARPDLVVTAVGVDIAADQVERARAARYGRTGPQVKELSDEVVDQLFTPRDDELVVRDWIRAGTEWRVADVRHEQLSSVVGPRDFVLANNILCHMYDREAEACLRNIAGLVRPGGYLVADGVDPDVRTRVVRALGFAPITRLIDEVYTSDPRIWRWPFHYLGREPMNKRRPDWPVRYASVFQRPGGVRAHFSLMGQDRSTIHS